MPLAPKHDLVHTSLSIPWYSNTPYIVSCTLTKWLLMHFAGKLLYARTIRFPDGRHSHTHTHPPCLHTLHSRGRTPKRSGFFLGVWLGAFLCLNLRYLTHGDTSKGASVATSQLLCLSITFTRRRCCAASVARRLMPESCARGACYSGQVVGRLAARCWPQLFFGQQNRPQQHTQKTETNTVLGAKSQFGIINIIIPFISLTMHV